MNERYRYSDHTKPVDTTPPKVDVVMIQVREDDHRWVKEAVKSVEDQSYPHLGLLIVDNRDRALTIGQAWNGAVQASDADLVLFLGDDDALVHDLVASMVSTWAWMKAKVPNLVHVTTNCTLVDDNSGAVAIGPIHHTGMFLRQFLVEHPFDESLAKGVGKQKMQAIAQAQKFLGQAMSSGIMHHYGYIFRQHPWMVGGQQVQFSANGQR